jgi:hypothetical protein
MASLLVDNVGHSMRALILIPMWNHDDARKSRGLAAVEEVEKRYQDVGRILAELLNSQALFIGKVNLIADDGTINTKALGYIYGFADCALQIAKLDIASPFGIGVLLFLIEEFDEANADRLLAYAVAPSDNSFMEGVMIGGNDYNGWASSQGKKTAIRWVKCF